MAQKWYIIHTYSGFEQKVKNAILERARSRNLEHLITEVMVPTETVEEMVKGERKLSSRKFYPGYVLVRMELTDESWHLVMDTPKVTGFVGSRTEPVAIPDEEAEKIITQMQEGAAKPPEKKPKKEEAAKREVKKEDAVKKEAKISAEKKSEKSKSMKPPETEKKSDTKKTGGAKSEKLDDKTSKKKKES